MSHPSRSPIIKPSRGIRLDWGHQLAPDVLCMPLNEGTGLRVFDHSCARNHGLIDYDPDRSAPYWSSAGITNIGTAVSPRPKIDLSRPIAFDDQMTLIIKFRQLSSTTYRSIVGDTADGIDLHGGSEIRSYVGGGHTDWDGFAYNIGQWYTLSIRRNGIPWEAWLDFTKSTDSNTPSSTGALNIDRLLAGGTGGVWASIDAEMEYIHIWSRPLSSRDIFSVTNQPYQFFSPASRTRYFNVTAGTTEEGQTTVIGVGLVDDYGAGARSAGISSTASSSAKSTGRAHRSDDTAISATSTAFVNSSSTRTDACAITAAAQALLSGQPVKFATPAIGATATIVVEGLAEEVSEGTGVTLVSAVAQIATNGTAWRHAISAIESWAAVSDQAQSARFATPACGASSAVDTAGTATESNTGICNVGAVAAIETIGLSARSLWIAATAASSAVITGRSGRYGALAVAAVASIDAGGTFASLGRIIDPSIVSLTVRRTIVSATVFRSIHSI